MSETSEKLDHTLQAYGRLERRFYEVQRELEESASALAQALENRNQWRSISASQQADYGELQQREQAALAENEKLRQALREIRRLYGSSATADPVAVRDQMGIAARRALTTEERA